MSTYALGNESALRGMTAWQPAVDVNPREVTKQVDWSNIPGTHGTALQPYHAACCVCEAVTVARPLPAKNTSGVRGRGGGRAMERGGGRGKIKVLRCLQRRGRIMISPDRKIEASLFRLSSWISAANKSCRSNGCLHKQNNASDSTPPL